MALHLPPPLSSGRRQWRGTAHLPRLLGTLHPATSNPHAANPAHTPLNLLFPLPGTPRPHQPVKVPFNPPNTQAF